MHQRLIRLLLGVSLCLAALAQPLACLTPPAPGASVPQSAAQGAPQSTAATGDSVAADDPQASLAKQEPLEPMNELDAWAAARLMAPGINIGNTLENIETWETGWGNPPITKAYVESLARLGFKTVRLPVAWDTYSVKGRIQPDKLRRVGEVVDWIIGAGMFAVVNVHWDGGWIDSSWKERYEETYATFSAEAERKYRSYWQQIASYFAGKNEKLIFEALNEETNFENEGSKAQAFATLTRVQQIFIDTVRSSGGNNRRRLLMVAGYHTDIEKTCSQYYALPKDTVDDRLFISVHYYTPWQFCGMTEDADWGKMMPTWGSPEDVAQLNQLFDKMANFCTTHDIPAFIGELGVVHEKESASRVRWMTAVMQAALSRKMVPVVWETGNDMSRHPPYEPRPELAQVLQNISQPASGPVAAPNPKQVRGR